jgi:RNA polymerase sigma factor (sigma-70 family)
VSGAAGSIVSAAVADAHRREWAFVLAATVPVAGDLGTAEEAAQDAFESALTAWPSTGVPRNPGAWLTTVARRKALDRLRRAAVEQRALPKLVDVAGAAEDDLTDFPDDRLRLIFTCCHPALSEEARIALTLRMVCGLQTAEVARAFLVSEPTMAARITRAKQKIARARIPYRIPSTEELPERLDAVLAVVHLLATTGHTAPSGGSLRRPELADRALELAALLRLLLPGNADVAGLLALVVLSEARAPAREDAEGRLVLLEHQDRTLWDRNGIARGVLLLEEALAAGSPGRFTLMAAIAAVHDQSDGWAGTDWHQILGLYDLLVASWPSPVVRLNRAIAVGLARGAAAGLRDLDELATDPLLVRYPYLAAARADFLVRLGRREEAALAYAEALVFAGNDVERRFLEERRAAL